MIADKNLAQAKKDLAAILHKRGVEAAVGFAGTAKKPTLEVRVRRLSGHTALVPSLMDGYPVRVKIIGNVKKQS